VGAFLTSRPFNLAASSLYGIAAKVRNAGYETGLFPIREVEGIKTVSVGNLRAGGSGKTPFAMHLAASLQNRGLRTALLLRGYRGRLEARGGFVSKGQGPLCSPIEAGDEAYLAASRLKGVHVLVGADRAASARRARDAGAQVLVLDDGFQHRSLHRDLNILLACPEDLSPTTRLLPAGPLRETASQARRADLIAGLELDWRGWEETPQVLFEYVPTCLVLKDQRTVHLASQSGARVFLVSAIARPQRFGQTARSAGFNVVGDCVFKDHHRFRAREIREIETKASSRGADAILTTEKDLSRLMGAQTRFPLWALRIDAKISSGFDLLKYKIDDIANDDDRIPTIGM
jgi:tetraacyldisaccharide 4'-kinase